MPTLHDPSLLTHAYTELPTLSKWKKDSYVGDYRGPARSKDPALVRIDQLVGEANDAEEWGEKAFALGELFFATMGWLNHYKADDRMDPRRRPWILKLNLCVGNRLAALYEVRLIELAGTLRELYGIEMTDHGLWTDFLDDYKGYMDLKRRQNYRVLFRHGLAYRFVDDATATTPLIPLSSEGFSDDEGTGFGHVREGVLFVMSLAGEVYWLIPSKASYHSNLLSGGPVLCAGTMVVEGGRIKQIANDSGHYKPIDEAMVKALLRLQSFGVDVSQIKVVGVVDDTVTTGAKFLAAHGNWESIRKSGSVGAISRSYAKV